MGQTFLVIGGDAAGLSAASKAVRDDPDREVVVLERGDWASYGACGLPYYVEGRIADLSDLVVLDPRTIIEERGIDLRRGHEAVAINPSSRTVTVDGLDGTYDASYDDLLLAMGGRARLPTVPGSDLTGVFSIRSLEAGRALRDYIAPHHVRPIRGVRGGDGAEDSEDAVGAADVDSLVIVGANKIGLELAEAGIARSLDVHVVHEGPHVLPAFGPHVTGIVQDHLDDSGVTLHLDTDVDAFRGDDGRVTAVETSSGVIGAGAVVADVGVEPRTDLARDAGVELGETGAIATDEYGRTSDDSVYAAGDCAETRHLLTGEPVHWPYALAANRAGRAIGRTIAGRPSPVGDVVGTLVTKALDLEVARTGLVDDEALRTAGFDPVSATITSISRAHYYPGWSRIVIHGTADQNTGRVLGATLVGEEGVAHRINSVATAVTAGLTVEAVGNLDFGYSPPFGPVWDPVLGVAKVIAEKLDAPDR